PGLLRHGPRRHGRRATSFGCSARSREPGSRGRRASWHAELRIVSPNLATAARTSATRRNQRASRCSIETGQTYVPLHEVMNLAWHESHFEPGARGRLTGMTMEVAAAG